MSGSPCAASSEVPKKQRYRKAKPWDDGSVDKWNVGPFTASDNKGGQFAEQSSFSVLFPQYREAHLREAWPDLKLALKPHGVKADLNLTEGSMMVSTTSKTFDPYIIIKAKILLKLLSRSVPLPQAVKILDDDMAAEIVKIAGVVRDKEKFVKRRQRLLGPDGSTLKALELLTRCYILVQGQTVCLMGPFKGIKKAREVVLDCMRNVHPVYYIKELMLRRELEKRAELEGESWDKYLPQFKKRNVQRKKRKIQVRERALLPPEQQPRKEDIAMATGEYFLTASERKAKATQKQRESHSEKQRERESIRAKAFVPGAEHRGGKASRDDALKKSPKKQMAVPAAKKR